MNPKSFQKLDIYFRENPTFRGKSAADEQILQAEKKLRVIFNSDYKELIKKYGGCDIGLDIRAFKNAKIQGIETVVDLTHGFRQSVHDELDFDYLNYLAISDDGSGNAILIHHQFSSLFLFEHDSGCLTSIFDSLDDVINKCL